MGISKKLIFKSSNAQSKGVSRKEGVEASNCLKQLSTSICWPQREKYLIVFASEARPIFSTVMQADMDHDQINVESLREKACLCGHIPN